MTRTYHTHPTTHNTKTEILGRIEDPRQIREEKIHGINVTVPFKKKIIPFLDVLTDEANKSQSVNTIYKIKDKIIGDNTDIEGFKIALETTRQIINNKTALIIGAGGVVPSIIIALKKLQIKKIFITNRTERKWNKIYYRWIWIISLHKK